MTDKHTLYEHVNVFISHKIIYLSVKNTKNISAKTISKYYLKLLQVSNDVKLS